VHVYMSQSIWSNCIIEPATVQRVQSTSLINLCSVCIAIEYGVQMNMKY
jgi:hypothetical protein